MLVPRVTVLPSTHEQVGEQSAQQSLIVAAAVLHNQFLILVEVTGRSRQAPMLVMVHPYKGSTHTHTPQRDSPEREVLQDFAE